MARDSGIMTFMCRPLFKGDRLSVTMPNPGIFVPTLNVRTKPKRKLGKPITILDIFAFSTAISMVQIITMLYQFILMIFSYFLQLSLILGFFKSNDFHFELILSKARGM